MSIRNDKRKKGIPPGVIGRLPIYYRFISELSQDQEKISSSELGKALNMTAAQIRSDFSYFGSFGLHGYGYRIDELKANIAHILGLDQEHQMVLIGAGNLGRAIASYKNFSRRGFKINAIFDANPALEGQFLANCIINPMEQLEEYLTENECDIGVIATPRDVSQSICDRLVKAGVKAIWNFSPIQLKVPDNVILEHTHLTDSLLQISFKLADQDRQEINS